MTYKTIAYSISKHQSKYLEAMNEIFDIHTMMLPETRYHLVESNSDIAISNSYYHNNLKNFNVMDRIALFSDRKKVVTFSHSTYGSDENIYKCVHGEYGKYFAVPSAWKNILGYPCFGHNSFIYEGHFMSLFHYKMFPLFRQSDIVLYMPIAGIRNINEVKKTLKNLMGMRILIKVHPVIESGNIPHKWNTDDIGISFQEYLDFADAHSNISIVNEIGDTSLINAIDRCKYIIGVPPTSTLIEAAIRGKIYNDEKLIVATSGGTRLTNDIWRCTDKYGMNLCDSPRISDFSLLPEHTMKEFVIGKRKQENEIINVIKKIKLEKK